MSPKQLQQNAQTRAEQYHRHYYATAPGRHEYAVCRTCGNVSLNVIHTNEPNSAVGQLSFGDYCSPCAEIRNRYPELFKWLGGVFWMSQPPEGKD